MAMCYLYKKIYERSDSIFKIIGKLMTIITNMGGAENEKKVKLFLGIFILLFSLSPNLLVNGQSDDTSDSKELETVVKEYYDIFYDIYLNMEMQDVSHVLDMESVQSQNKVVAIEQNIETWKYSIKQGYTIDYRDRYPIFYDFKDVNITDNFAVIEVDLDGDSREAYPPFVTFGKNTFLLKKTSEGWHIYEHDYIELEFFELSKTELIEFNLKELQKKIDMEHIGWNEVVEEQTEDEPDLIEPLAYPYDDYSYSSSRAVAYANKFYKNPNTYFYVAGKDCTNFVSQCVAYGFGSSTSYTSDNSYRMVKGTWSAGSGGGFPAWESVTSHWDYMTKGKSGQRGPRVAKTTWSGLKDGGVMQIDFSPYGSYNHSVICVSKSQKKFAQHTDNRYRNYDDYQGNKRFYNPTYFREY